jgi:ADP-ribose pyrophosphatase YjhB (NUDIX family)
MYKIFINDKPFVITDIRPDEDLYAHCKHYNYEPKELKQRIKECEGLSNKGIVLLAEDVESAFNDFYTYFVPIKAAGGFVYNTQKQILLIKRMGKWDLPKGKIDAGENVEDAAMREVEEECGIQGLQIIKALSTSYHTYKVRNFDFIKITYWFEMHTSYNGALKPQLEEMITEVKWTSLTTSDLDVLDTYESIKQLLRAVIYTKL